MLIKDNIMLSDIIMKKILVNIVRKYSFILVNVLLILFLLHNIIYIHYFTNVFPVVIEHFANVLFMFIVNVSNIFFSFLLKIFCVCWVLA